MYIILVDFLLTCLLLVVSIINVFLLKRLSRNTVVISTVAASLIGNQPENAREALLEEALGRVRVTPGGVSYQGVI